MPEVPILNGVYTDIEGNIRTSYPKNYFPIPKNSGVSKFYLRPAHGIQEIAVGPGIDRGGIVWNDTLYRVMGENLVKINSLFEVEILGSIPGTDYVKLDYSFSHLGIITENKLYLYDGTTIQQVTDSDLGNVFSGMFIDGYWMTTDGESVVVTDLNNPFNVNPLKYEGSIVDPDPIVGVLRVRDEAYILNRHTIEIFKNIGGTGFPFASVKGSTIQKGCVGRFAFCLFKETVAFLGSGRNESLAVYVGANGEYKKISTREIEQLLKTYSLSELSDVKLETMIDEGLSQLRVHLPDRTLVYDTEASSYLETPVWYTLQSGLTGFANYRGKNLTFAYGKWICGDALTNKVGELTFDISSHFGDDVEWEFSTTIIFNGGRGVIFKMIELSALPGRQAFLKNPTVYTSYSLDGLTWSQEWPFSIGRRGDTGKRITWFTKSFMRDTRIQKFRGLSDSNLTVLALNIEFIELNA